MTKTWKKVTMTRSEHGGKEQVNKNQSKQVANFACVVQNIKKENQKKKKMVKNKENSDTKFELINNNLESVVDAEGQNIEWSKKIQEELISTNLKKKKRTRSSMYQDGDNILKVLNVRC